MSSAYKSRSISPELRSKLKDVSLNDDIDKNGNDIVPSGSVDDRPPFVVRKVMYQNISASVDHILKSYNIALFSSYSHFVGCVQI